MFSWRKLSTEGKTSGYNPSQGLVPVSSRKDIKALLEDYKFLVFNKLMYEV